MERIAALIARSAWLIVAVSAVLTIGALVAVGDLRIENVPTKFLPPQSDPVVRESRQFKERFGDRSVLIVGLDYGRKLRAEDIRHALQVGREIEAVPGVERVWSLANALRPVWDLQRPYFITALRGDEPDSLLESRAHDLAATEPLYRGSLISADGRWCGIVVEVGVQRPDVDEARRATTDRVEAVLEASAGGRCRVALAGTPLLNRALETSARRDLRLFGWLSTAVMVGLLALLYRQAVAVVLAIGVALVSLAWSLALLPLTGTPLSASLAMIVPLVLVISAAYSSHYLAHFFGPDAREEPVTDRFRTMLEAALVPGLLCGLTTVFGFASLAVSRLEAIQELGGLLAGAVMICALLNAVLLPALLWVLRSSGSGEVRRPDLPGAIADRMARAASYHPWQVMVLAALITTILGAGMERLSVNANPLHFFTRGSVVRASHERIDEHLGGSLPVDLIIERDPTNLAGLAPALEKTERRLRSLEPIGWVGSGLDALLSAERARPRTAPPLVNLRTGQTSDAAWRRLQENPATAGFVHEDSSGLAIRVTARLRTGDAEQLRAVLDDVKSIVREELSGERVTVTGQAPVLLRTHEYVVESLVRSFAAAFVPIFAIFAFLSGSWVVGGAAAAANLLPLIAIMGAMGWVGVALDTSTGMIASIALGIIVDDTIHFVYRYRRRPRDSDTSSAIRATHRVIGPPVMVTLMVMTSGFLVLAFSSFAPTRNFGWLSALTLCSASLGDMLVLPAILVGCTHLRERRRTARH